MKRQEAPTEPKTFVFYFSINRKLQIGAKLFVFDSIGVPCL
jgi:hypothetical protein